MAEVERSAVTRIMNVFSDALGIKVGQDIYVVYRASMRNSPHVKRARVVQAQATLAGDGKGEITLLCEDANGVSYVYRYDQVLLDLNAATRYVTIQALRDEMGLDEFCHVVDPRFRFKRKHDGDVAADSPRFDPTRKVDEDERQRLLRRINERVLSPDYWRDGFRK